MGRDLVNAGEATEALVQKWALDTLGEHGILPVLMTKATRDALCALGNRLADLGSTEAAPMLHRLCDQWDAEWSRRQPNTDQPVTAAELLPEDGS